MSRYRILHCRSYDMDMHVFCSRKWLLAAGRTARCVVVVGSCICSHLLLAAGQLVSCHSRHTIMSVTSFEGIVWSHIVLSWFRREVFQKWALWHMLHWPLLILLCIKSWHPLCLKSNKHSIIFAVEWINSPNGYWRKYRMNLPSPTYPKSRTTFFLIHASKPFFNNWSFFFGAYFPFCHLQRGKLWWQS